MAYGISIIRRGERWFLSNTPVPFSGRPPDSCPPTSVVQNVGIGHGRFDVFMLEPFLLDDRIPLVPQVLSMEHSGQVKRRGSRGRIFDQSSK